MKLSIIHVEEVEEVEVTTSSLARPFLAKHSDPEHGINGKNEVKKTSQSYITIKEGILGLKQGLKCNFF